MPTPIFSMTDTWDDPEVIFTSILMNVTATAYADGSAFLRFQYAGVDNLIIGPDGLIQGTTSLLLQSDTTVDITADTTVNIESGAGAAITLTPGAGGSMIFANVPTADPEIAGAVWNSSGTIMISAG